MEIPITIVPRDNDQAIMTSRPLTPEEAEELTGSARTANENN
ncbi:MAG: hypothetical protein ACRDRJ_02170 [Streptosporangiaceae bacterium]